MKKRKRRREWGSELDGFLFMVEAQLQG